MAVLWMRRRIGWIVLTIFHTFALWQQFRVSVRGFAKRVILVQRLGDSAGAEELPNTHPFTNYTKSLSICSWLPPKSCTSLIAAGAHSGTGAGTQLPWKSCCSIHPPADFSCEGLYCRHLWIGHYGCPSWHWRCQALRSQRAGWDGWVCQRMSQSWQMANTIEMNYKVSCSLHLSWQWHES